eukprot:CAMPEP_0114985012 /NCGR_PEP_ID=MMETSP0216-20121206/7611_1 /TAXON_ID=223996 /ORGANISM="Protocruzia adherens, Strain Boccale" /LENGTH=384 /DNA_ID=CAMNT_0002347243 /DNA_START=55 /DNA_END=1209 /DNA_ORIENTATION=+
MEQPNTTVNFCSTVEDVTYAMDDSLSLTSGVRQVNFNNPKRLNAIGPNEFRRLGEIAREFHCDHRQKLLLYTGEGRVFTSGGDLPQAIKATHAQRLDDFYNAYKSCYLNSQLKKPFVAIWDGVSMGGGIGASINAGYKIVSEKLVFSMPECKVGFAPDVGAAKFLQNTKNIDGFAFALYVTIASSRLNHHDAVYSGMADYFIPKERLSVVVEKLSEEVPDDLDTFFHSFAEDIDFEQSEIFQNQELIEAIFGNSCSVEQIMRRLETQLRENPESTFLKGLKQRMDYNSPLSMKVTFQYFKQVRDEKLEDQNVYLCDWYLQQIMFDHFSDNSKAGMKAIFGGSTKRGDRPAWVPSTLEAVTEDMLEEAFDFSKFEKRTYLNQRLL